MRAWEQAVKIAWNPSQNVMVKTFRPYKISISWHCLFNMQKRLQTITVHTLDLNTVNSPLYRTFEIANYAPAGRSPLFSWHQQLSYSSQQLCPVLLWKPSHPSPRLTQPQLPALFILSWYFFSVEVTIRRFPYTKQVVTHNCHQHYINYFKLDNTLALQCNKFWKALENPRNILIVLWCMSLYWVTK